MTSVALELDFLEFDDAPAVFTSDEFFTPAEARSRVTAKNAEAMELWRPPPPLTVSEWADAHRYLPSGTSPLPGPWKTQAFQREIMDAFDDPEVHEIVCVKPTQVGWSEILNNIVGKHIHLDPKPMLFVQPSLDDAKNYGKQRITPMIEACPPLKARVRVATSRRPGNTVQLKEFPGGFLKLTGANSGKGLRSSPVPIVLFDEADAYPDDVDGEGDPIDIGRNRTEGYDEFKVLIGSTPAKNKGFSRVEKEYERSDQRSYHVPCPFCKHMQILRWRDPETKEYRLVFTKTALGEIDASSVRYVCEACKRGIPETRKQWMLDRGRWIARFPGRAVRGYHFNALYRPWKDNWAAMADSWVRAQGDHEALKEFIMLQLAEFWEEHGERTDATSLEKRREDYPRDPAHPVPKAGEEQDVHPWEHERVPAAAAVLTCQADVQGNRIEATVKAWGADEESWLIAQEVFWGDPSTDPLVWEALEQFRLTERIHESGARMKPRITLVDSGDGTGVDAVYDYVMPRQNLRECVFAVKGVEFHAKPVLVQEGTTKRQNVRLFTVATAAAKNRIFSRLKLAVPGPGYLHFPGWTTEEYFKQLTSEKKVSVKNKKTGIRRHVWVKTHERNEALDLEVYALAGLWVLQNILDPRFRDLGRLAAMVRKEIVAPAPRGRRVRSTGLGA